MEKAYAQALWQMVQQGKKPSEAVAALRKSLKARGRTALLPKVARAFVRLAEREESRNKMTLSISREKDAKQAIREVERVLVEQKIFDADVCEEVDEMLVGGWRLEGRGVLVDASWKKSLLSIYNASTQ